MQATDPLELWGGHECTVNRVGDGFQDQTDRSGHQLRLGDLERFADLGLKALRYPVLWERVDPTGRGDYDWRWTDIRLERIRALGMRPIAGLLHHGSGPPTTDLLADEFPAAFAAYAGAAARRYPWIRDWTPINEPLTTARFSALYGHWHPHAAEERSFWLALLNQIDATRLAMIQIRAVLPNARLIQTEDLGRTDSTRAMTHQALFDNERRWMTWDLLEGRVLAGHPLWARLGRLGLGDRLSAIADAPSPPSVVGVNHYLTSDRFLDHRCDAYPPDRCGANAFMAYADVEAVRCVLPGPAGLEGALEEAWLRYGRPLAVTESHNACTREEQVRWIREAWETCERLRDRGVSIEAVTAWSLLGSYDWNSLLTRWDSYYEVGAFDTRCDPPRPTALAAELKRLASGSGSIHPATLGAGWWTRDIRLQFAPVSRPVSPSPRRERRTPEPPRRPLLVTGATGTLGRAIARACEWRGIDYRLTARLELDLSSERTINEVLDKTRPWAVINAAGWVRVDDAQANAGACMAANAEGALRLAVACMAKDTPLVGFSSDLVFDGRQDHPYLERDPPSPLNIYGVSKARADADILALGGSALIVRTAAFFSPDDPHNFASQLTRALAAGQRFRAADDLVISPTYVPDLVDVVLDLLIDGERGLRHLANPSAVTWAGFAKLLAQSVGLDEHLIDAVPWKSLGWTAPRPAYVALDTERGQLMPPLGAAVDRYAKAMHETQFGDRHTGPPPMDSIVSRRLSASSGAAQPMSLSK